jgi:phosphate starvation-inducible PhoH-like protein
MAKVSRKISIEGIDPRLLFGQNGMFLKDIEKAFESKIVARGETISLKGDEAEVENLEKLFADLIMRIRQGNFITDQYLNYCIDMVKEGREGPAALIDEEIAVHTVLLKSVKPRTLGQKEYLNAIDEHDIVFAIGPAGTGKTYLAVAVAVAALREKSVNRLVLVRPAVEAGESLGFLPGDIRAKVDPYLRPVYDALHEMMPAEKIKKLIELGVIEIAPLAFMRGRTLNRTFVILDEGQNTTTAQMKMFLTRLGEESRAVITGDITQIDLEGGRSSGLVVVQRILKNVNGVKFVYLTDRDVVRHRLVQQIIRAYERYEKGRKKE